MTCASRLGSALAAVGIIVCSAGLRAQTRPNPAAPAATQATRFEAAATAIVVDVIVRDRRGSLVTDLTAEAFDLYGDREAKTRLSSVVVAGRAESVAPAERDPKNPLFVRDCIRRRRGAGATGAAHPDRGARARGV